MNSYLALRMDNSTVTDRRAEELEHLKGWLLLKDVEDV